MVFIKAIRFVATHLFFFSLLFILFYIPLALVLRKFYIDEKWVILISVILAFIIKQIYITIYF